LAFFECSSTRTASWGTLAVEPGDPGFEIGHVKVGIHEISGTQWVVLDGVVLDSRLFEIVVLLPDDEHATQEVDVGVGDGLLVRRRQTTQDH
jgi:hypothetical protein